MLSQSSHDLSALERPTGDQNIAPKSRYQLVVIGAGSAGLATATAAADLGATVCLIERGRIGGRRLYSGEVPLFVLQKAAALAADGMRAPEWGICGVGKEPVRWEVLRARIRHVQSGFAERNAPTALLAKGIDFCWGTPRFLDSRRLELNGQTIEFVRAVIATGSSSVGVKLAGMRAEDVVPEDALYSMAVLPDSVLIYGTEGQALAVAQALRRLGCEVTVIEPGPALLAHEDPDAVALVRSALAGEGISIHSDCGEISAAQSGSKYRIKWSGGEATVRQIICFLGRTACHGEINLAAARIEAVADGILVNDFLYTTNPRVLALGSVNNASRSWHDSEAQAKIGIANALLFGHRRNSPLLVPRAIRTDPAIAMAGVTQREAEQGGLHTLSVTAGEIDRAVIEGDRDCTVKIHHDSGGRIHGVTIVGREAPELLGVFLLAMNQRTRLHSLVSEVPLALTRTQSLYRLGDLFRRTLLTPFAAGLVKRIMSLRK